MNSTSRFTSRVADYVRYRPGYPAAIVDFLHTEGGVPSDARVADVGSGTGISSKLFLDAGHEVIGIEPNDAMRFAADAWLNQLPGYRSQAGTAEATNLPDAHVGLVAAAQAFHWFNSHAAKAEFHRILKPAGRIALFWNSRRLSGTAFLEGYEAILQEFGTDYSKVAESYSTDEAMQAWFGSGLLAVQRFDNSQRLDFPSLEGRLQSSSYAPQAGDPKHQPMIEALKRLFERTAQEGTVSFDYDTRVFVGESED